MMSYDVGTDTLAISLCHGSVVKEFAGNGGALVACGWLANQPFSISADRSVRFWNAADGTQTRTFSLPATVTAFAISADTSRMAFAGDDQQLRIVQTDNGNVLQTVPTRDVCSTLSFS
ncbi:MAG: hypothetical protein MUC47_11470, partial [Candidatus Kapabacteria bacterium]|nr:hypothetical protein [Candidatus Kapabacteria bacterium]